MDRRPVSEQTCQRHSPPLSVHSWPCTPWTRCCSWNRSLLLGQAGCQTSHCNHKTYWIKVKAFIKEGNLCEKTAHLPWTTLTRFWFFVTMHSLVKASKMWLHWRTRSPWKTQVTILWLEQNQLRSRFKLDLTKCGIIGGKNDGGESQRYRRTLNWETNIKQLFYFLFNVFTRDVEDEEVVAQVADRYTWKKRHCSFISVEISKLLSLWQWQEVNKHITFICADLWDWFWLFFTVWCASWWWSMFL